MQCLKECPSSRKMWSSTILGAPHARKRSTRRCPIACSWCPLYFFSLTAWVCYCPAATECNFLLYFCSNLTVLSIPNSLSKTFLLHHIHPSADNLAVSFTSCLSVKCQSYVHLHMAVKKRGTQTYGNLMPMTGMRGKGGQTFTMKGRHWLR